MSALTVILVRPQLGENIGAAARACKNFGCEELRLVAPRDGWPNAQAEAMSAHASDLIKSALLYESLTDAVADCHLALAATARPRGMDVPVYTPREAAGMVSHVQRTAYVFGPENNGLTNEDIAQCHGVITIPTAAYSSLNLAQSVVLLAYEYFIASQEDTPVTFSRNTATLREIEALHARIVTQLDSKDYYPESERKHLMQQRFKQLLLQANLTSQQVQSLQGMVGALTR